MVGYLRITDYDEVKHLVFNYLRERLRKEKGQVMTVRTKHISNYFKCRISPITLSLIISVLKELNPKVVKRKDNTYKMIFNVNELRSYLGCQ